MKDSANDRNIQPRANDRRSRRFSLGHGPASAAARKHVILIMMENDGTDTLLGNKEDVLFHQRADRRARRAQPRY